MKRSVLLFVVLALLAAVPAAAPAASWKGCGDQPRLGAGWYDVTAQGVGCRTARAVAKRYTNSVFYGGNPSPAPFGFACQDDQVGIELTEVACRKETPAGVQKVRFEFGA